MNTNHTRTTDARPNNPRGMASRTIKQSEQETARLRADRAADAAEHGRGETLERQQGSDVVARQRDGSDQDARHRADRRRNSKG